MPSICAAATAFLAAADVPTETCQAAAAGEVEVALEVGVVAADAQGARHVVVRRKLSALALAVGVVADDATLLPLAAVKPFWMLSSISE